MKIEKKPATGYSSQKKYSDSKSGKDFGSKKTYGKSYGDKSEVKSYGKSYGKSEGKSYGKRDGGSIREERTYRPKSDKPAQRYFTEEDRVEDGIVFGRNPVAELLKSGRAIDKLYVIRGEREGSILRIMGEAKDKGIPIVEADKTKLDSITRSGNHQGVVAFTTEFEYCEPEDILAYAKEKNELPLILIIDGINDPMNLGALIRTAEICGVHGIILPKRNSCGLTPAVYKAAAGACEYMKIARVVNITAAVDFLKENNVWLFGTDGSAEIPVNKADFKRGAAIVLGSEGKGISRLVAEHCDYLIKIPMAGHITSLNISAAGAITLYEAVRQRSEE